MKNIYLLLAVLSLGLHSIQAQLEYYSPEAMDGYTLYDDSGRAYLVNNCGEKVNEWTQVFPTHHAKLLPNGNLIYISGFSNEVVERNWDGDVVNRVEVDAIDIGLDYEVIVLPNGNYLCLARKSFSEQEFRDIGYNIDGPGSPSVVDAVLEIDPNSGEIVWMWVISDHVIQERSDTLANYGSLKDNPQLLNMDAISLFDWTFGESFMINGFDYNSELDQIILSVRKMSEVVIIDHSTTTEEAAGHVGGNAGKGGDILYRWGNPQNYDRGTEDSRSLYLQHNPNWIEYGEHKGRITIFNNGLGRPSNPSYSSAPIIDPPMDKDGNYILDSNYQTSPDAPIFEISSPETGNYFYSGYTSGSKILPNGNIFITIGEQSKVLEIQPDGTLVWEYGLQNGYPFRAEKYPSDYTAFENRDLTPMGTVEFPSSKVPCDLTSSVKTSHSDHFQVFFDSNNRSLNIKPTNDRNFKWSVINIQGIKLLSGQAYRGVEKGMNDQVAGIYFIHIRDVSTNQLFSYKFLLL